MPRWLVWLAGAALAVGGGAVVLACVPQESDRAIQYAPRTRNEWPSWLDARAAPRSHPLWLPEACAQQALSEGDRVALTESMTALLARNYRRVFNTASCCCAGGVPRTGDLNGDGRTDLVAALSCADPSTGRGGTEGSAGFALFLRQANGELTLVGTYHPFDDAPFRALAICGNEVWVGYRHQQPDDPLFDLPAGAVTTVVQKLRIDRGTLRPVPPERSIGP